MNDIAESTSSMAVIYGVSRQILVSENRVYITELRLSLRQSNQPLHIRPLTVDYESVLQVKQLFPQTVFAKFAK
jgi:hypothetical protein